MAASESQLFLINDILDMSKIESGKFTIEESSYSIQELVRGVKQMLALRVQDKGLELTIEQYSEPHKLYGDPQRIKQILRNA